MRRIGGDDLASDEPIEHHADGGQVLLERRLLEVLAQARDLGGEMHRLDVGQLFNLVARIARGENTPAGVKIRRAGVRVGHGDGEDSEKAAHCFVDAGGYDRGNDRTVRSRVESARWLRDQRLKHQSL